MIKKFKVTKNSKNRERVFDKFSCYIKILVLLISNAEPGSYFTFCIPKLHRWGLKKDSVSGDDHPTGAEVREEKRFPGIGIRLPPSATA